MSTTLFIPDHPSQQFTMEDREDNYQKKDEHYIRFLQSLRAVIDIDAYIIDYQKEKILSMTDNCLYKKIMARQVTKEENAGFDFFNKIMSDEDLKKIEPINRVGFNFYYSLPIERRIHCSFNIDIRILDVSGKKRMLNYKISALDVTPDGKLRLGLCVLSTPLSKTPGKAYFKMTDDATVYEYIESAGKFIEVKTQKLSSKSLAVLEYARIGKTEKEISELLHISLATVKYHKQRIFHQLNVRNIAEAINWIASQKKIINK